MAVYSIDMIWKFACYIQTYHWALFLIMICRYATNDIVSFLSWICTNDISYHKTAKLSNVKHYINIFSQAIVANIHFAFLKMLKTYLHIMYIQVISIATILSEVFIFIIFDNVFCSIYLTFNNSLNIHIRTVYNTTK